MPVYCSVGTVRSDCGPAQYVAAAARYAAEAGVDPRLMLAILDNESGQYHGPFEPGSSIGVSNMQRQAFETR